MTSEQKRPSEARMSDVRPWDNSVEAQAMAGAFHATATRAQPIALEEAGFTHPFHSYAGRMHPLLVRTLIHDFTQPGERVLDPFCGSGTTLVEGMAAQLRCRGSDVNPLAVRLTATKSALKDHHERMQFVDAAIRVHEQTHESIKARELHPAPLPKRLLGQWSGHVLRELGCLHHHIQQEKAENRVHLEMVLSAIVVKFSRRQSDTSPVETEKRIRKGLANEFFLRKAQQLEQGWKDLHTSSGQGSPSKVCTMDALRLDEGLPPSARFDWVITSPPYLGTYNYADNHELRYPWLNMRQPSAENEIGSRRNAAEQATQGSNDPMDWEQQLRTLLHQIQRRLTGQGGALFVVGDGQIQGQRVPIGPQLDRISKQTNLTMVTGASRTVQDFTGGKPRREHIILFKLT